MPGPEIPSLDAIVGATLSRLFGPAYSLSWAYGFADMSSLLSGEHARYERGLSIARRLEPPVIDKILEPPEPGPTPQYLALYHSANKELTAAVESLATELTGLGITCLPVRPTLSESELDGTYQKTLTAPVSHKMVATRAGMGWVGKTDLLVTFRYGPRVRLASLLFADNTTVRYRVAIPVTDCRCGRCRICVDACPATAASGEPWTAGKSRDSFFNAHACRSMCKALSSKKLSEDVSICGICLAVCPTGRKFPS